jgi:hypothetical protein
MIFNHARKTSLLISMTLGLTFLLTSCSPGESVSSSKIYSTIQDLQKAFIEAGGDCKNGKSRVFRHAESGIDCGDGYTNLLMFKDHATALVWAQAISALCNNLTSCAGGNLVGDNWAVVTQAPELFEKALGGTILK